MVIVDEEFLRRYSHGKPTEAQFQALGLPRRPGPGWPKLILGTAITDEQAKAFRDFGTKFGKIGPRRKGPAKNQAGFDF